MTTSKEKERNLMNAWQFTDFGSKDNLLRTIRNESNQMLELASATESWEQPTAAGHWQVRDVIGHLVDTTEAYFESFDAALGRAEAADPLGLADMSEHADAGALAFRTTPQDELLARFEKNRDEMVAIIEDLDEQSWSGLLAPHRYMGPLPACFYAVGQLIDYAVHSWDIREGSASAHFLDGDAADLLVPFCLIVWQSTAVCDAVDPFTIGIRVSGRSDAQLRAAVSGDGLGIEPGDVEELPAVVEFDASSFVLTVMGRINGALRVEAGSWV